MWNNIVTKPRDECSVCSTCFNQQEHSFQAPPFDERETIGDVQSDLARGGRNDDSTKISRKGWAGKGMAASRGEKEIKGTQKDRGTLCWAAWYFIPYKRNGGTMAGTRKNGMKWDRGRWIERKEERKRRTRASVKTHHSVNNARSESDSKSGGILRVLPSVGKRGMIEDRGGKVHLRLHFSNISTFLIIDGAFFARSPRELCGLVYRASCVINPPL